MIKSLRLLFMLCLPAVMLCFSNCKKDQLGSGALTFSSDTLTFDTVFTTLGSTTLYFKVFNTGKKSLKIDNIQLAHLVGTQFRMNVDGVPGDHFTNVVIPPKDSLYVFVEVTVNPNSTATPFVIIDDVNFTVAGQTQTVYLQAFGQNAHYHYGEVIARNTEWKNDKPHVIIGSVLVDCGINLKIDPGCQVLFASTSALYVNGNLNATAGDWKDSIVFRGVRLEQYYNDQPGQWVGIVFLRTDTAGCVAHGTFSHCVVNESTYGIYAGAGTSNSLVNYESTVNSPNITIDKTIVKNTKSNAVYGFNARIAATNSLFYGAGDVLIKLGLGGAYSFTNCTMYNTGAAGLSHQQPVVLLSNFVSDGTNNYPASLNDTFTNCIIYGSLTNEISFNNVMNPGTDFNNLFSYSLLQTPGDTLAMNTVLDSANIFNKDPLLKNTAANDFTPSDTSGVLSPCIDHCPWAPPGTDLFDHTRGVSKTGNTFKNDIGAIEAQ